MIAAALWTVFLVSLVGGVLYGLVRLYRYSRSS